MSAWSKEEFLCIFGVDELDITMLKFGFRLFVGLSFVNLDDFSELRLNQGLNLINRYRIRNSSYEDLSLGDGLLDGDALLIDGNRF